MADREFKIKITTTADTAGAKETKEELNSLSPSTQKYIQSLKEQEDWSSKNELSHRQLTNALRHLSPELGAAAHQMHLFSAGPMGAVIAGGLLITETFKHISEAVKKMQEDLNEEQEIRGAVDAALELGTAWRAAMKTAEQGMAEFEDRLHRIATAQTTLKEKTDDAVEALKHQADLDKKNLGEEQKRDLAEIAALKKAGLISEAEAARREFSIKEGGQRQGDARSSKAEQDEINARQKELAEAKGALPDAEAAAKKKEKEGRQAQVDLAAKEDELRGLEDKIKKEDKLQQSMERGPQRDVLLHQMQLDKDTKYKIESEVLPELRRNALGATGDQKQAEKKAEDLANLIRELERTIGKLTTTHGENDRSRGREAETRGISNEYESYGREAGSPLGKTVGLATQAVEAHARGQQASAKAESALLALEHATGRTESFLGAILNHSEQSLQRWAEAVRRIDALERRARSYH